MKSVKSIQSNYLILLLATRSVLLCVGKIEKNNLSNLNIINQHVFPLILLYYFDFFRCIDFRGNTAISISRVFYFDDAIRCRKSPFCPLQIS